MALQGSDQRGDDALRSFMTAVFAVAAALFLGAAVAFLVVPTPARSWLIGG